MDLHDQLLSSIELSAAKSKSKANNFHLSEAEKQRLRERNDQIVERLREGKRSQKALAKEFGVSQTTVFKLNKRFIHGIDPEGKTPKPTADSRPAGAKPNGKNLIEVAEAKLRQARIEVNLAEAELYEAKAQMLRLSAKQQK